MSDRSRPAAASAGHRRSATAAAERLRRTPAGSWAGFLAVGAAGACNRAEAADLIYRERHGLAVVDYKTDTVPVAAIDARVAFYRPQLNGYVRAVEAATGEKVAHATLLFLYPQRAIGRRLECGHLDQSLRIDLTAPPGHE